MKTEKNIEKIEKLKKLAKKLEKIFANLKLVLSLGIIRVDHNI